ncbi:MAG: phage tail tape measure protein family [Hyphomicrobiales bacterium]|nr:phage tail tape measure protein family [Hyphomicrobiales bacterium]
MAVKTIETKAIISASDRTGSVFAGIVGKMRSLQMQSDSVSKSIGRTTQVAARAQATRASGIMAGGQALVGAVAAYGVVGQMKESVRTWADLEAAVTRLGNTGEVTDDKIKQAIGDFRKLGPAMGMTAKQVASAAEIYVAAGIDFDKAIEATPAALKAAKASGADLNDIASSGVAAMNNLGIQAGGLDRAFDIMAKGGKLGSFELKNMARELPAVASRAKALGLVGEEGLTKIVAMLETTRKTASTGEEAANNLLNFFDKIVSQDTTKHFKKMGINLEKELKAGATKGKDYIQTTLELVEKVAGTDPFKIAQLFPDRQAREGIMALIKFKDTYRSTVAELKANSIGTNTRDFDRQMKTADEQINKLSSSWDRFRGNVGERIGVPVLLPIIQKLNETFDLIRKYEDKQAKGDNGPSDGQKRFNSFMNGSFNRPGAGTSKGFNEPDLVAARQTRDAGNLEDSLIERMEDNLKKIEALNKRVLDLPQASPLAKAGKTELERMGAEVDALQARIQALQATREAIARLTEEGAAGAEQLRNYKGRMMNQPVGASTGGPTKLAFGRSIRSGGGVPGWKGTTAYANFPGGTLGGSHPILQPPGQAAQMVQLDPSSKAQVDVTVTVKASNTLIEAFTEAQNARSSGNVNASVGAGSVGKTGVGQ